MKAIHVVLAYATVVGFVMRAYWAFTNDAMRNARWVRIAPHAIDTALLVFGVLLAWQVAVSPFEGWLAAKLAGLVVYIGFGVLTLRASTPSARAIGLGGALTAVGYVFAVAYTRNPWPFG
jgi:uncharacterized membrane protein SirB2